MNYANTILLGASLTLAVSIAPLHAVEIINLGNLPVTLFANNSEAEGISADGSVVVGYGTTDLGFEAFRWTADSGMAGLGDLPGPSLSSFAKSVSADGAVVVGQGTDAIGQGVFAADLYLAFRWTEAGGMVSLGDLPVGARLSEALSVSADGLTIVGYVHYGNLIRGTREAFRWSAVSGMVAMGDLPGGPVGFGEEIELNSAANGVSADGSVIVGHGRSVLGSFEAFRWTAEGGMVGLGDLPGGPFPDNSFESVATAVSADGAVVVGYGLSPSGREAFRWTADGGMAGLGFLPGGSQSEAYGVSADGSVVVGLAYSGSETAAVFWDKHGGIHDLLGILSEEGADVSGWNSLEITRGVSANGLRFVGRGVNSSGRYAVFLADLAGSRFDSNVSTRPLISTARDGNGSATVVFEGTLETSLDLLDWSPVEPQPASSHTISLTEDHRFFRAVKPSGGN